MPKPRKLILLAAANANVPKNEWKQLSLESFSPLQSLAVFHADLGLHVRTTQEQGHNINFQGKKCSSIKTRDTYIFLHMLFECCFFPGQTS